MQRVSPTTRTPRRVLTRKIRPALMWEVALLALAIVAVSNGQTVRIICGVLLALLLVCGIPWSGRSIFQWVVSRLRYGRRRRKRVADPGDLPVDLVPLAQWTPGLQVSQTRTAQGNDVGVVTDGESWTAILALSADEALIADSGERIDLEALSGLTRQDDIVFAGVQVVTYTVPAPASALLAPNSPANQAYLELSADPPPAVRRTWICVRLDPRLCLEAVARRGASTDGIYATLRFGLHRVQTALKRQGISTRVLSPHEIYDVLSFTTGSTPDRTPDRSTEAWRSWACDGLVHTGAAVNTRMGNVSIGYQQLISALDRARVLFAVTSYTINARNEPSIALRIVTPNQQMATDASRELKAALPKGVRLGSIGGVQVPTVLATVPLGREAVR